jgi:streptogramin lyase
MKFTRVWTILLLGLIVAPLVAFSQPKSDIREVKPKKFFAPGNIWKGESVMETNWNKICMDPQGRIWFSGGDHWGTDRTSNPDRYERPWGYGNTIVSYYDPRSDKVTEVFNLDMASAIFSDAETPGHGKIHSNINTDSKGNIWTAGYMGASYDHEFGNAYFPKSYAGGAVVKWDARTKQIEYFGVPCPYGGLVALYFDEKRNTVHGFSVDRGRYFRLNYVTRELKYYETNGRFGIREMIMDRDGMCYFANEFGGLTQFNPDTETFKDLDMKIPGLRASAVSSKNIIYGVSASGFLWSYDIKANKVEELGHVVSSPKENVYTPNIAIDEDWGRLYMIAGGHGITLSGMPILTIYDLKTKKFAWPGKIDVDGCYGAVVGMNHAVYFSCYGYIRGMKNKEGKEVRGPMLVRYDPPKSLEGLNQ